MQQGSLATTPTSIGMRRILALATVSLAVTLIVMDGSIVNVALPTFVRSLGGASNSELQWIVDGYILVFATLLLSMGNAADRFGRRRLLVWGAVLFGATSIGATTAVSPAGLVAWRAAMGVGAAMIFPSTLAILTHAFPEPRLRRMAIGVWAGCSGLGVAIGPVVGGWILRHHAWGAIFLVNVPVVAAIVVGTMLAVRESRESGRGPLDLRGNALAIAGLLALVWSLIEAPERGWGSLPVMAGLATGVAFLAVFIRHERRAEHPMLDLAFFGSRACMSACLAIGAAFFGLFGFVFMVTQFFQFVKGLEPLEAGVRTLPFAGAIVIGAAIASRLGRTASPRAICGAGLLCMAAGFGWAVVDRADTEYGVLVGQMAALGVGLGLVSASATDVVMSSLASDRLGLASSLNDTARELGGTLGVAAMGSVFNAVYRGDVDRAFIDSPLPETARSAARESLGVALGVAERVGELAGPAAAAKVRGPVVDAFIAGFHASSLVAAALAVAGACAAFAFMPRRRVSDTAETAAPSPDAGISPPNNPSGAIRREPGLAAAHEAGLDP